jgi:preprotein translocase subunit Sec63
MLLMLTPDVFLAVHPSASEKDIRHAYKRLSKKYHPDKNKDPDAEARFVDIAYGRYFQWVATIAQVRS